MASKNTIFTENLKKIIADSGLGNHGFAEKADISYSTLMTYFSKKNYGRVAEWDLLVKIADTSGRSIEWLLTGKDYKQEIDCPVRCGKKLQDLCEKVKNVIESPTSYSGSLEANINSFHEAVEDHKDIKELRKDVKRLTRKITNLEKTNSIGQPSDTQEKPAAGTGSNEKAG